MRALPAGPFRGTLPHAVRRFLFRERQPSCMSHFACAGPHGAVRIWVAVEAKSAPGSTGMPSPVPMSCSRKSLYGWMILFPTASRTRIAPPLIRVPGAAVRIDATWQPLQPAELNNVSPARTVELMAPRGGALLARMKLANATTSTPSSSGSGTGSKGYQTHVSAERGVLFGQGRVVIPISFR